MNRSFPPITVGKGQQFDSFTACVYSLRNDHSEKIIYVHEGEYDVFRELHESGPTGERSNAYELRLMGCGEPKILIFDPNNRHIPKVY